MGWMLTFFCAGFAMMGMNLMDTTAHDAGSAIVGTLFGSYGGDSADLLASQVCIWVSGGLAFIMLIMTVFRIWSWLSPKCPRKPNANVLQEPAVVVHMVD